MYTSVHEAIISAFYHVLVERTNPSSVGESGQRAECGGQRESESFCKRRVFFASACACRRGTYFSDFWQVVDACDARSFFVRWETSHIIKPRVRPYRRRKCDVTRSVFLEVTDEAGRQWETLHGNNLGAANHTFFFLVFFCNFRNRLLSLQLSLPTQRRGAHHNTQKAGLQEVGEPALPFAPTCFSIARRKRRGLRRGGRGEKR